MNVPFRKRLCIAGLLFLSAFPLMHAEQPATEPTLNDEMVINHFMGNLQSMVVLDKMSPELQKNVAQFNYGLLFQFWTIPKYRTTFLKGYIGSAIFPKSIKLIDLSDPLLLRQYYSAGELQGDGLVKTQWLMLNHADKIFAHERDYDQMVAAFRQWVKTTSNSPTGAK